MKAEKKAAWMPENGLCGCSFYLKTREIKAYKRRKSKVAGLKVEYKRLKKQSEMQNLFKSGSRAFSGSLTLLYLPAEENYFAVSVGKKHGKSVQRNRIKRLVREAFRLNVNKMKGTYKIVCLPKVRDEYSFATFDKDVQEMIRRKKL